MTATRPLPIAIVIGRWQLPHLAHKALIDRAFEVGGRVVIVIGSAYRSRNPKNPFREFEREAMLLSMMTPQQRECVDFLPVRDYFDDARWVQAVREGVNALHPEARKTLVGFQKDESSYYLNHFPSWDYVDAGSTQSIDATHLRNVYFASAEISANLSVLTPYVDANVLSYLGAWSQLPEYQHRRAEHLATLRYKEKYPGPYYLTADSVLQVNGHVLLIRRGGEIGQGQWALPGGFLDKGETLYSAALRELAEETRFSALPEVMQSALKGNAVFDHPERSPRGRLITQAFHFQVNSKALPEVRGADDAKEAAWWPLEKLHEIEADLFEDHAAILDHFLGFRSAAVGVSQ